MTVIPTETTVCQYLHFRYQRSSIRRSLSARISLPILLIDEFQSLHATKKIFFRFQKRNEERNQAKHDQKSFQCIQRRWKNSWQEIFDRWSFFSSWITAYPVKTIENCPSAVFRDPNCFIWKQQRTSWIFLLGRWCRAVSVLHATASQSRFILRREKQGWHAGEACDYDSRPPSERICVVTPAILSEQPGLNQYEIESFIFIKLHYLCNAELRPMVWLGPWKLWNSGTLCRHHEHTAISGLIKFFMRFRAAVRICARSI